MRNRGRSRNSGTGAVASSAQPRITSKGKTKPNKTLQPIRSLLKIPLFISFEHWRLSGYHFHLGLSWRQLPLYTFESLNAGSREKPRESSLEAESSHSNLRPTALSAMHVEKMAMQGTDCWATSDSALKARHYHPTSTVSIFFSYGTEANPGWHTPTRSRDLTAYWAFLYKKLILNTSCLYMLYTKVQQKASVRFC